MTEPQPQTYWVNIYRVFVGSVGTAYETRELADQMAARGRIACKEICVVPGEGLEDKK
jgi:hypothetical protein